MNFCKEQKQRHEFGKQETYNTYSFELYKANEMFPAIRDTLNKMYKKPTAFTLKFVKL